MKIISFRSIYGPNVFHSQPVIIMTLDLGPWKDVSSVEIPGFSENLCQVLPGLMNHSCSRGYRGGFWERLQRGTYLAHIIEHVALELSDLAGIGVSYGKTRYAGVPGLYDIAVRFLNEAGMRACLQTAVDLTVSVIHAQFFETQKAIADIKQQVFATNLGPSALSLLQAAKKRGIPFRRIGDESLIQLGYGRYVRRLQAAVSDRTSLISADIAQDKKLTKEILKHNFIPVPEGRAIRGKEEIRAVLLDLKSPYAVKPVDSHHGLGVSLNLSSFEEILNAFEIAKEHSSEVLIEEMCPGRDYRILMVDGHVIAAAERIPPTVTGDGRSTMKELIEVLNQNPLRGQHHENRLTKVTIDEILTAHISKFGWNLDSVVPAGEKIILRPNANLSSGGTARDVTSLLHPEVKSICERMSRIIGLDICGIDLIHSDISEPLNSYFKVIEVNAGPGLRMHLDGDQNDVADRILDSLFPPGSPCRIPIVSVTGTNGKTTVVRLISRILESGSKTCVGMTTTEGIWIGGSQVVKGDTTGPQSAQVVLSDPKVEVAVLELARGGLLRGGLAYDWSDVAVLTNIRPDHIGQDGIENLEDLTWIKSLVPERVKENGWIVINADDPQTVRLMNQPSLKKLHRNFMIYSISKANILLKNHLEAGGDGAWIEKGFVYLKTKGQVFQLLHISDIPITLGGMAQFQCSNVLAAITGSIAAGAHLKQITETLKSFEPSIANLGRVNIYKVQDGYVVLDYGHNPDAILAMSDLLNAAQVNRKTAVIGLPGDRADELLFQCIKKVAHRFDRFIFRDDYDLRGRQPGEVPAFLKKTLSRLAPEAPAEVILDQSEAVERSLQNLGENDVVVIFYDVFETVNAIINQYDPIPVTRLPALEDPVLARRAPPQDVYPDSPSKKLSESSRPWGAP